MADVWKVGVSIIADTAGIDAALAALGLKMLGLQGKADELGARFGRMSAMMLGVGSAMVASGAGILKVYYDIAKAGDKIVQQQAQMRIAGIGEATVSSVTNLASTLATQIGNTTTSGIMETWSKLRPTLGDKEATAALPGTESILAGLSTKYPDIANQAENMFKAMDLFGAGMDKTTHQFNADTWNTSLNALARLMAATHGMINPSMLLQIARGGGVLAQGADFPSFLEQMAASFMEQGSRAGYGMLTLMGEFIGGRVTKRTAEALEHYGLVNPRGITRDHGVYSIADPEKYVVGGTDIITKGLGYWVQNYVLPALQHHGVNINDTAQVIQAITKFVGDQRAARTLYTQGTVAGRQQTARDAAQLDQAITNGAPWSTLTSGTLAGALASLSSAFDDLYEKLGYTGGATRDVTNLINQLAGDMRRLNAYVAANPDAVNLWVSRFGELGAALVWFGGTTVVGAIVRMIGPRGYLALLGAAIMELGNATGNSNLTRAGQWGMAGSTFGPWGAVAGGLGGYLWDRPAWLPKWLDETPAELVGQITPVIENAFKLAAADAVKVLTDAAAWARAAETAGAQLAKSIEAAITTGASSLLHDANPMNWWHHSSYNVPPSQSMPIQLTSYTTLDGRVIARTVTAYQGRQLAAPQTGPSGFNPNAVLPSPGQTVNL